MHNVKEEKDEEVSLKSQQTNQVTYSVFRKLEFHLKDHVQAMAWYDEVLDSSTAAWSIHSTIQNWTTQIHFKGKVLFSYCSDSFFLCSYWGLCDSSLPAAEDRPPTFPAPLSTWTSLPLFVLVFFHTCKACTQQHTLLCYVSLPRMHHSILCGELT